MKEGARADGDAVVKEHPIIFTGDSVQAILAGRKTQTRRIIPLKNNDREGRHYLDGDRLIHPLSGPVRNPFLGADGEPVRLWVRETWAPVDDFMGRRDLDDPVSVGYRADHTALCHETGNVHPIDVTDWNWDLVKWKPSIFMPHWASRLLLDVVSVRAERLQDISEEDSIAEGIQLESDYFIGAWSKEAQIHGTYPSAKQAFASRWDEINAKRGSWDSNPLVFALTFRRTDAA